MKAMTFPSWLRTMVKNKAKFYGIGGVHYHSMRGQIKNGRDNYTRSEVEATLAKRVGLSDQEIGGDYASTEVTNLIVIKESMKALGVKEVYPVKVDLTQGLMSLGPFESLR